MKTVSHHRKLHFSKISPPHVQYNFNKPEEVFLTKSPMSVLSEPEQFNDRNMSTQIPYFPEKFPGDKIMHFW